MATPDQGQENTPEKPIIESLTDVTADLSNISDGDLLLGAGHGNTDMYYEYIARKMRKRLDETPENKD